MGISNIIMIKRISFISDTHNQHESITRFLSGGDILIHAGDATGRGTLPELTQFFKWFESLDYTHKILIAGNHDWGFQKDPNLYKKVLEDYPSITYLQDSFTIIDGIKIYGSPWQPEFFNWAFNLPRGGEDLREKWFWIPNDTDILITHGPPKGYGDYVHRDNLNVGCELLLERIKEVKPTFHVCGHIHLGHGHIYEHGVNFINASVLDDNYYPAFGPYQFDWNVETGDLTNL
jgi:Icc-related predicted phosphoesterase